MSKALNLLPQFGNFNILDAINRRLYENLNWKTMQRFIETGGIRVGRSYWLSWNASIPFAKLAATETELTLSGLGKTYAFPQGEPIKLSRYNGAFSTGLQIEHSNPNYPKFLVFWTFRFDEVKCELEALGYQVKELL